MGVLKSQLTTTGMIDSPTSMIFLSTNDTSATITTAGYLNNNLSAEQIAGISKYMIALIYADDNTGTSWYRITINTANGIITLTRL
jgi:hypothetical protein